jgi:uncharacterized membrane-anchored protein
MIQRIQTIYFFLAAVSYGILFLIPMAFSNKIAALFFSDQFYTITDHPVLLGMTLSGILAALISIFTYKNRPLQVRIGYGVIVLAIAIPLTAYMLLNNATASLDSSIQVEYKPGFLVPIGAVLFGILAILNIRKDERLVKSMDRLR